MSSLDLSTASAGASIAGEEAHQNAVILDLARANRVTVRVRGRSDHSRFFDFALHKALGALKGLSCSDKVIKSMAFSVVAVPTVVAYYLNNMNDSGLPKGLKISGGVDGAYVNMIFSGLQVPTIVGAGFKAAMEFFKHGFDSTYMSKCQFVTMFICFPICAYLSYATSLNYNLGVQDGIAGLRKDGWKISRAMEEFLMYSVAQNQVLFNAILTMPPMLRVARWATDCMFLSREDLQLQQSVRGLRSKVEQIERTESLHDLLSLLQTLTPLMSIDFKAQRDYLSEHERQSGPSSAGGRPCSWEGSTRALFSILVIVASLGLYVASVGGLASTVKEAKEMPVPSKQLSQGLKAMAIDHFWPAALVNLPTLAFAIYYGFPGVFHGLRDMAYRVKNNLDGTRASQAISLTSYLFSLLVVIDSGVTSFAQAYNGNGGLPDYLVFRGLPLTLCLLSFLAALFSNLGGTFVGMHGIHKAPFLALSNYCCGQKSDSAAALAQPLLQDREERQEAAIEHPELTPRQKFTAGIEMAKALIEVLEAAAAGSGKAAERDFGRATFESPLGSAFYQARIQHYQEAVRRASVFEDLEE